MKFNIYTLSFFLVIFIIIYPLTFYFSEKKIVHKNKTEIRYKYDLYGYFEIRGLEKIVSYSKKQSKKINNKYFEGKNVLKVFPENKFSRGIKKTIMDSDYFDVKSPTQEYMIKNTDFILSLSDEVLFFYDFKNIYNFFSDEVFVIKYSSNNFSNSCSNIRQEFRYFKLIDYSTFNFKFSIHQDLESKDELEDNNKIVSLLTNCFEFKIENMFKILNQNTKNFLKITKKDFTNATNGFITNNTNLFTDTKHIDLFKKDMKEFQNNLQSILVNLNNDKALNYSNSNIRINENFQKNVNIYVVSFILSFMVSLIIFYLLFFFKKRFILLNKIF